MRFTYFIILTGFLFFLTSCEEIGPDISVKDTVVNDTTYVTTNIETPQTKAILLEDFTGVRCVNCPKGNELGENLSQQHSPRVVYIALHTKFLGSPYNNDPDLRTDEGEDLEDYLGGYLGKPAGGADRVLFANSDFILESTSKWANFVDQRLSKTTAINLHLDTDLNTIENTITVTLTLHYTQAVSTATNVSIMILEDGIIASQLREDDQGPGDIVDENYVHKRVLRAMLTSFDGLAITENQERGRVITKSFQLDSIPADWDNQQLTAVAFVHNSTSKEVIHVAETDITN